MPHSDVPPPAWPSRPRSPWARRLGWTAFLGATLLAALLTTRVLERQHHVLTGITPLGGHAWSAAVPLELQPPDDRRRPGSSGLQVLEDGQPLGPAHSTEAAVAAEGRGRFVHRMGRVVFSTPDGSDPAANGRSYEVVAPMSGGRSLEKAVAAVTLLASLLWFLLTPAHWRRRLETLRRAGRYAWVASVVLLLAAGVALRLRYTAPLVSDGDTWGYLGPAINAWAGRGFNHVYGRHFLYPLLVKGTIDLGGTYQAIAVLQHALGVLSGVLVLAAWHRIGRWLAPPAGWVLLHRLLGLILLAVIVLYPESIRLEHMLRPEAVYMAGTAGLLLALTLLLDATARRSPSVPRHAAAVLALSLLAACLRPQSMLQVPVCLLAIGGCLLVSRPGVLRTTRTLGATALCFVALIWFPEQRLQRTDASAGIYGPGCLLSAHMPMIAAVMRSDLADPTFDRWDRELLVELLALWDADQAAASADPANGSFPRLGYNPQQPFYHSIYPAIRKHWQGDLEQALAFCNDYYLRSWLAEPRMHIEKIRGQLGICLDEDSVAGNYSLATSVDTRTDATASLKVMAARNWQVQTLSHQPTRDYMNALESSSDEWVELAVSTSDPARTMDALRWLRQAHGPLLLWGSLGALLLIAFGSRRGHARALGILTLTAVAVLMSVHLTSAMVFSLEFRRYVYSQHVLIAFSQACLALSLVVGLALVLQRAWDLLVARRR